MTTRMQERYRLALWSGDYESFNDLEKQIWHLADEQHVKVHDGFEPGEFLVRTDWVEGIPPRWEDPTPEIPRQTLMGRLGSLALSVVAVIGVQLLLVLAFFALIAVLHFVGVLPPL